MLSVQWKKNKLELELHYYLIVSIHLDFYQCFPDEENNLSVKKFLYLQYKFSNSEQITDFFWFLVFQLWYWVSF